MIRLLFFISLMLLTLAACEDDSELILKEISDKPVWVERTSGFQCRPPDFQNVEQAALYLQDRGVDIYAVGDTSHITCRACGCPNSTFYMAQIDSSDIAKAEDLGWRMIGNQ